MQILRQEDQLATGVDDEVFSHFGLLGIWSHKTGS